MITPYWKAGMPVVAGMLTYDTDLCDACGVVRWRHRPPGFCPSGGFASGYRRAVGPNITDQVTEAGLVKVLDQPKAPRR